MKGTKGAKEIYRKRGMKGTKKKGTKMKEMKMKGTKTKWTKMKGTVQEIPQIFAEIFRGGKWKNL